MLALEAMGMERVGVRDNFFELGGHSLLAAQVISRMRSADRTGIDLERFFQTPTIAELASVVEKGGHAENPSASPIVRIPRGRHSALSYAQERLWFLDQMTPNNTAYNIPVSLHLEGELDISVLRQSVHSMIDPV